MIVRSVVPLAVGVRRSVALVPVDPRVIEPAEPIMLFCPIMPITEAIVLEPV